MPHLLPINQDTTPILGKERSELLSNLVEVLEYQAFCQPDALAYQFLTNGETPGESLTYAQLQQEAKAIAACLQSLDATGERALLLYPAGLEFVKAFFGCLYAGVIAVPAYPPRRNHNKNRVEAIVENARAKFVLGTNTLLTTLELKEDEGLGVSALKPLSTNDLERKRGENWQYPKINSQSLAFLQYTSGSTGTPKGVMVSHANLIQNQKIIQHAFGHTDKSIIVGWLPLFHDMGLIGNLLQPMYLGVPCILISPMDFLQQPIRWLQAITRYRGTTSGGPNFAYDLCVRKISEQQLEELDLSTWQIAFNGAEPIYPKTLEQFVSKFVRCGFQPQAFYPCYGMAEATLFISGGRYHQSALTINATGLIEPGPGGKPIVSCGYTWLDTKVEIVNPETLKKCPPQQVGEIWVSGQSVTQGYWQQPQKTAETFKAYVADTGDGPFLRTGDLGYLDHGGELFVTGRLKDLIIIRGRNHYPQDIERTVEQSHSALIPHRSAAFSVEVEGEEKLVVAVEVERRHREQSTISDRRQENADPGFEVKLSEAPIWQEIVDNIRQSIVAEHGLQVYGILLLRVGSIPKTSSGKIQRYLCRQGFQEKSLMVVYSSLSFS